MSFSVYYKFKSQRQESRVTFDGTGISVFDLKKEIILQNNLKASDIDLLLFDNAEQEYKDDSYIIPRSTSVIAKRMPASRPGRGRAAIYVANVGNDSQPGKGGPQANPGQPAGSSGQLGAGRFQGVMSKRFDGRDAKPLSGPSSVSTPPVTQGSAGASSTPTGPPGADDDEQAQIAAMFAATEDHWEETKEKMAQSRVVYNHNPRGGGGGNFHGRGGGGFSGPPRPHQPDTRPLPPGYICHRCNKKGHWIQDCPTNDDREYDNRPRVKRTTGIPRSFLKAVDISAEGTPAKGVMVTPEGGFVVAEPDSAAWERQRAKPKGLTEADVKDRAPRDPALACPICTKVLKDAVKTPCCQTSYCEECIHTHLLEGTFECPNCQSRIPSLDKLKIDSEMRAKVREYIRETVEESRREAEASVEAAQPSQAKTTPDPKDLEYSETQPGGNDPNSSNGVDPQAEQQQQVYMDPRQVVTQIQAQLAQLMIIQSNPTLPHQQRMTIANQIQQLTFQLKQAEQFRDMMNMNMNGGMGMMNNGGMGMGGMGMMNQGMGGMGGGGYGGPQQYGMQQGPPNAAYSAYDRLPVNNRRAKRDRPDEFGDGGPNSKRQYWE